MFPPSREVLNLPDNLYEDYTQLLPTPWSFFSTSAGSSSSSPVRNFDPVIAPPPSVETMLRWISVLPFTDYSDQALENLVKNRNKVEILPVVVWDSVGTVHHLLGEVVEVYKKMSAPLFDRNLSLRVYNIFLLFQSIAHHPVTRPQFLRAEMPYYFFPFMDIGYTDKPRECLRLGAMGVIAHLLKAPVDGAATRFLMDTGAFRYCTRPIAVGSTESKTLAVYILQRIMATDEGLKYCCVLADRFFAIDELLKKLLGFLASMPRPSASLFNLIVACYARLSQKKRGREGLRRYAPVLLLDGTFANLLAEDPVADNYRKQLIENLQ